MWTCEICKTEHHWYNDACDNCSAFNETVEFQWMCDCCEVDNVLQSDQCRTCGSKREWKYVADYNWECLECTNVNSFKDKKCRKCKIEGQGFVRKRLGKLINADWMSIVLANLPIVLYAHQMLNLMSKLRICLVDMFSTSVAY